MAFQRFTRRPFNRGRSSFSRSRRGALRKPGDKKWEKSQFFIGQIINGPTSGSASQAEFFHIASIAVSLQQETVAVPTGVALGSMTRKMLIGGIEFDWGLSNVSQDIDDGSSFALLETQTFHQVGLCSDNLTNESGSPSVPASLLAGWNPFLSAFPTSILTASTPSSQSFDPQRPLHIHWKHTDELFSGVQRLVVSEDLQLTQIGQRVITPRGHVSKRLRLVLDDKQGLFFYWAIQNPNNFGGVSRDYSIWFCGTLFWRYQL